MQVDKCVDQFLCLFCLDPDVQLDREVAVARLELQGPQAVVPITTTDEPKHARHGDHSRLAVELTRKISRPEPEVHLTLLVRDTVVLAAVDHDAELLTVRRQHLQLQLWAMLEVEEILLSEVHIWSL